MKQSKTSVRVDIPLAQELKNELDPLIEATKQRMPNSWIAEHIILTERGTPWTEGGFRASWRKACQRAGITNLSFHDLRGTAVTRLAIAGCTVPEIATITGHSLKDVGSIIDTHYLSRNSALAQSAMTKLEAWAAKPSDGNETSRRERYG